ncbi:MAG: hypothetical protein OXU71_11650 [Gammaproteobacteria bacterium]|nr:hypothetical protein [Gammaproteobacteria bacterium]
MNAFLLAFCALFIIATATFADHNRTDEHGRKQGHWHEFDEYSKSDGGMTSEGHYVDGKKHGYWLYVDSLGNAAEGKYENGERHGKWIERSNWNGVEEGEYVNGRKHGMWTQRFADGTTGGGQYVNGRKHGYWDEVAKVSPDPLMFNFGKGHYIGGSRHGHWVIVTTLGSIMSVVEDGPYIKGKKHGQWVKQTLFAGKKGEEEMVNYRNGEEVK